MQPTLAAATSWTLRQKVLFRFAFCVIMFWTLPFPFGYIPYVEKLESIAPWFGKAYDIVFGAFRRTWEAISDWVASDILRFTEPLFKGPSGSARRKIVFLALFSMIAIAVLATLIWKNDSIKVMLKKYDLNIYRLHRAKFKWIVD